MRSWRVCALPTRQAKTDPTLTIKLRRRRIPSPEPDPPADRSRFRTVGGVGAADARYTPVPAVGDAGGWGPESVVLVDEHPNLETIRGHLEQALVALEELRRLEHLPVDETDPLGGRDE